MSNSSFEISNGFAIVHIEGTATIDTVAQIYQTFSDALESQLPIALNLVNTTDCDCSFIQLTSSLCYTLNRGGRSLIFLDNQIPEIFDTAIKTAGFKFRCNCTRINNIKCPFSNITQSEQPQEKLL